MIPGFSFMIKGKLCIQDGEENFIVSYSSQCPPSLLGLGYDNLCLSSSSHEDTHVDKLFGATNLIYEEIHSLFYLPTCPECFLYRVLAVIKV